jgi:hypothetical protein
MLELGTKVRYEGRDAVIVARTLEREAKYDLLFSDTRQIQPYILGHNLGLISRTEVTAVSSAK